jgi:hypothetical protein
MLGYEQVLEGCTDMICTEGLPCVFHTERIVKVGM